VTLEEMRRRRAGRLAAPPAVYHATTATAPDHTGESGIDYCADCKTDVCHRWNRVQARLDRQRYGWPRRIRMRRGRAILFRPGWASYPGHTAPREDTGMTDHDSDDDMQYRDDVREELEAAGWHESAGGGWLIAPNGALWSETNESLDSGVDAPDKSWSVAFDSGVPAAAIVAVALVAAGQLHPTGAEVPRTPFRKRPVTVGAQDGS
jgi:hypothetical protein